MKKLRRCHSMHNWS